MVTLVTVLDPGITPGSGVVRVTLKVSSLSTTVSSMIVIFEHIIVPSEEPAGNVSSKDDIAM